MTVGRRSLAVFQRFLRFVNQVTDSANNDNHGEHNTSDDHGQRHVVPPWPQNALPMNGSIRPKYMTPMDRTSADAPRSLPENGASAAAGSVHASS